MHESRFISLKLKDSGLILLLLSFALLTATMAQSKPGYAVEIRRTSHGIPHITAKDYGSLGFGEGYAFAQYLSPM